MKKQTLWYKFLAFSVILISMLLSFVSCAKSARGDLSAGYDGVNFSSAAPTEKFPSNDGIGNIPTGGIEDVNAKIIKTATTKITTTEFDSFIENLYAKITELSGYTDSESFSGSAPYRYANISARIPADKLDTFKNHLSKTGILTHYSATKEDVTVTYATVTAELNTLKEQRGAISALLQEAETLEQIQSLTAERYEIDTRINKLQATLDAYDEKISYSTVYVNVSEAKEYEAPKPTEKEGAFVRIWNNLKENIKRIGNFFVEFFVWFVSAIPYLIIIGALATALGFGYLKLRKIKAARRMKSKESALASREQNSSDNTPAEKFNSEAKDNTDEDI